MASAPNQKVIMIPLDAANVIGALGGIAELAKDAMQNRVPSGGPGGGSPSGGGGRRAVAAAAHLSVSGGERWTS